ncbi:hypothetical protein GCM10017567_68960 [Amycolatopsis bullii]|uniref:Uncharacterized protein n=1 Tax=Amycolatopsis bullii TaxID=941987 RepID=A0ABQ3KQ20_9PSEU|nr:hypothetical protein GCM10017567_68960 [Amycolatopsis bullii]
MTHGVPGPDRGGHCGHTRRPRRALARRIPVFGFVTGFVTDWLALEMIFYPRIGGLVGELQVLALLG